MNWSGGGGAISYAVAPTTNKTYTATFMMQYYLTMTYGTDGTVRPEWLEKQRNSCFDHSHAG